MLLRDRQLLRWFFGSIDSIRILASDTAPQCDVDRSRSLLKPRKERITTGQISLEVCPPRMVLPNPLLKIHTAELRPSPLATSPQPDAVPEPEVGSESPPTSTLSDLHDSLQGNVSWTRHR